VPKKKILPLPDTNSDWHLQTIKQEWHPLYHHIQHFILFDAFKGQYWHYIPLSLTYQ